MLEKDGVKSLESNTLFQNEYKLWEMYVEGNPMEVGMYSGALSDSLYKYQETVFFEKVEDFVPSKGRQRFLRNFLKWYNRKLFKNVIPAYREEIYGLSQFATDRFDFIGPKFPRTLYLHGAHDIGHALQDLALVGCTSFAAWGNATEDGKLIVGRNFDFYAGDDFARNKVVAFVKPDSGYAFASVTWPGMVGVVSGMNSEGLTVTINAGKSSFPLTAKTPISLLTREVLQYAADIDQAIEIAKRRKVFVSESIMVASAAENRAILIEVSPKKFGVYEPSENGRLVCSNHFQSQAYGEDKKNTKHIEESHSFYRFERMNELLDAQPKINVQDAVDILRNTQGTKNTEIGKGNEKALNQLLAHHGVIFKPAERKMWVSANPYQLGAFVAYDLNAVFSGEAVGMLHNPSETVPADDFLYSVGYKDYERYRILDREVDQVLKNETNAREGLFNEYLALNPELWSVYFKIGKYFYQKKAYRDAIPYFEKALEKEVTTLPDMVATQKYLEKCKKRI